MLTWARDFICPPEFRKRELAELILNFPRKLSQVDRGQIPAFITLLSSIQAALAAQLASSRDQSQEPSNGDRIIGVQEAAQKVGVTEDWLYRHTEKLPFVVRLGRSVRF